MIDFARIIGFDWDDGNSRKSLDRHGVEQSEAEQVFLDRRLLVLYDDKHSGGEERYHAYGRSAVGRQLLVSFTLRHNGSFLRVISARDMSRKERERYAQEA
jgi:uncharacterized DUF497 family protein